MRVGPAECTDSYIHPIQTLYMTMIMWRRGAAVDASCKALPLLKRGAVKWTHLLTSERLLIRAAVGDIRADGFDVNVLALGPGGRVVF
ncbi:hypothetical protein F2P81_010502 [Scophthalmus maximus]|uniref:Uncharacterized protein n=1 Tax=Scophthalmus maximus TaxID=52904 RepID=A0A6A4T002_SCOMX|nr:hypothetical protein F2P81_010502 [Scophthalmus maximus]